MRLMFESIVVRRTTPIGASGDLDLGRLAEALLFYQKTHLALTRSNLRQLILDGDPDLAIRLVENPNVDAVFLDRVFSVVTENTGTGRERYRPTSLRVMRQTEIKGKIVNRPESHQEYIYGLFEEAIGDTRKSRKRANRFLDHVRAHEFPDALDLGSGDWEKEEFIHSAFSTFIGEVAPSYPMPQDLHIALNRVDERHFAFESNLDWSSLRAAQAAKTGPASTLDPGQFLLALAKMREDLYLSAALDATLSQDDLGAHLMRIKCADLCTASDMQQFQIDQFQHMVVRGLADVRGSHGRISVRAIRSSAGSRGGGPRGLPRLRQVRDRAIRAWLAASLLYRRQAPALRQSLTA
jgi:hypothetical protein